MELRFAVSRRTIGASTTGRRIGATSPVVACSLGNLTREDGSRCSTGDCVHTLTLKQDSTMPTSGKATGRYTDRVLMSLSLMSSGRRSLSVTCSYASAGPPSSSPPTSRRCSRSLP